jgi:hypothetical protein
LTLSFLQSSSQNAAMSGMIESSSEGAEVLEEVQGVSGSVPSGSKAAHNDLAKVSLSLLDT